MPTHVALLRGINVGRVNRIAMADLRQIAVHLGYTEVATYLQSGNVVFTQPPTGLPPPPVQQDEVSQAQREILEQLLAEVVADGGQDHLTVVGRTTYLCTPDGLGRSRLADRLARRKGTQDDATARNWRTVEAIAALLGG